MTPCTPHTTPHTGVIHEHMDCIAYTWSPLETTTINRSYLSTPSSLQETAPRRGKQKVLRKSKGDRPSRRVVGLMDSRTFAYKKTIALNGRIRDSWALGGFPFNLKLCAQRTVETAIPIAVENRQETFVVWRTPRGGETGTDRCHIGAVSPPHVILVLLLPIRVYRRVFNVLSGRTSNEPPEMIEWMESSLTALSSKVLS